MSEEFGDDNKKPHRNRHSGRKAEKKSKKKQDQDPNDKQRNPKAFAFNSAIRAERRFRRKQDIDTKKQHVPLIDRTPLEPPPILVAVVGPPKVGKSTLINNLLKLYTKSPLTDIKGPVTVVAGKKRRITFIECNNDINSMIDLAKVADLALLLCDASFGFEMEIFEFLDICKVHGMPRIMGVLTHLDMIKNAKTLKNTKKTLKHRFWTEVYPGAKLFYLTGIIHGNYLKNEVTNLGRFISVMKYRPLTWRTTHSYFLVDRFEDLTNVDSIRKNEKCDRKISLYGYVRGIPWKKKHINNIHIPGYGDTQAIDIGYLPDPCPLPEVLKKRALVEKEKMIYAPFSGVGGIIYDKDAVYYELGGSHSHKKEEDDETNDKLKEVIMKNDDEESFNIFSRSVRAANDCSDYDEDENETDDDEEESDDDENESDDEENKSDDEENESDDEKKVLNHEDDKEGSEDDGDVEENKEAEDELKRTSDDSSDESYDEMDDLNNEWKKNLQEKAKTSYLQSLQSKKNLNKLVYGVFSSYEAERTEEREGEDGSGSDDDDGDGGGDVIGGLFKVASLKQKRLREEEAGADNFVSTLHMDWNWDVPDFAEEEVDRNLFVTGKWKESEDASALLALDDMEVGDSDSDVFGDFEDLETGEKFESNKNSNKGTTAGSNGTVETGESEGKDAESDRKSLIEKKLKLKEKFNEEYDNGGERNYYDELKSSAEMQSQLNRAEFEEMDDDERVLHEGYRPGMYVRIEIGGVPSEFVANFDPTYPLIVGALNEAEENVGYVNVKLKKHRWYKRILKANDPLIISLGWRRFQTIPLYSKLEDDLKFRYLKYTPEHVSCYAHFWGPITAQQTGFLALQSVDGKPEVVKQQGFRIAATGSVQQLDKSLQVLKKLKLIGHPLKIYKKTAFIKGMFNSSLEVARFEGAKIKTVSGIRGVIKKASSKPEGCFRATFEDKILLSDIVFCRTWFKVDVQQFYNTCTNLLLPADEKDSWKGARTLGEIKRDRGVRNPPNVDSMYTEIEREPKVFKPLVVPKKLQRALPYRDKVNHGVKHSEKKKEQKRVAVVKEPHEQKVDKVMKMIKTAYAHKKETLKRQTKERLEKHRQAIEEIEKKKRKKVQEKKKVVFRAKSKAQKAD